MASGQAIKAGRAFVELAADDSKLNAALRSASGKLRAFGRDVREVGMVLAGMGAAITAPLTLAVKTAADAQATMARFKQVFGEQADAADAFGESVADALGRSQNEMRSTLATFQAFFRGLNFDNTQARELSQGLTQAGLDLAAFYDIADDEAMGRLRAALSGSSEVLDQFGVNIKAAAIDEELLRMGLDKTAQSATEQEKVLARLNIIRRSMDMQGATGQAAREADELTNQLKALRSAGLELAAAVGSVLVPTVTPMVAGLRDAAKAVADWAEENPELVGTLTRIAGTIGVAGLAGGTFAIVLGSVAGGVANIIGLLPNMARGLLAVKAAMLAVTATPLGLALTAIAAVAGGAYLVAMQRAAKGTEDLAEAQQKLTKANDEARKQDRLKLDRLQQLAAKQTLTNDETEEAARLTEELEGKYGDLGAAVDKMAQSLTLAADAQERLNQAQQDAAIADVQAEVDKLRKLEIEQGRDLDAVIAARDLFTSTNPFISGAQEDLDETRKQLADAEARLRALTREGTPDDIRNAAAIGNVPEDDLQARVDAANAEATARERTVDAARELAAIDEQISREGVTRAQASAREIEQQRRQRADYLRQLAAEASAEADVTGQRRIRVQLNADLQANDRIARERMRRLQADLHRGLSSQLSVGISDDSAGRLDSLFRGRTGDDDADRRGHLEQQIASIEARARQTIEQLEAEAANAAGVMPDSFFDQISAGIVEARREAEQEITRLVEGEERRRAEARESMLRDRTSLLRDLLMEEARGTGDEARVRELDAEEYRERQGERLDNLTGISQAERERMERLIEENARRMEEGRDRGQDLAMGTFNPAALAQMFASGGGNDEAKQQSRLLKTIEDKLDKISRAVGFGGIRVDQSYTA